MSKVNELRSQRAKAWDQAKAFMDSHRNEKGILSAEDTAAYEKMEQEIVDLDHEIERQARMDALVRELAAPVNTPITAKPESRKVDEKVGRASDSYKKAFWSQARAKDGVSYEIRNALSEGVDSEGGYLVPDEFEKTLISALGEANAVREHAHVFSTSNGTHKIPVVVSKGTAAWIDENGAYTEADDVFGMEQIDAHKVGTIIKVSEELLYDSAFDLEAYFREGEFDTILGKKIYTSPFMPTAAAGAKTILFGDLSYYWIGDRQGVTFKRLNERYADMGQVGFLASKRVDGKLVLPEAVKVLQQKPGSSS